MSRCWLAFALLVGLAHVALADEKADCSYLEIAASSGNQPSIDPELKPLEKKLKKPPFSSWNVFRKLSGGSFVLQKLKAEVPHLQQGAASLLLRDRNDHKLELTITVDGSDGKRVIDTKVGLAVGDWSLLVNNVKDAGHILALTCK